MNNSKITMGVREKVALSVVVIVLVGIACTFCIPRSAKKSALKNYYNTLRKSKINRGHKGLSNQFHGNHDFSNYIQQNQPVDKVFSFPEIEFPQMSNTYQMPDSILNADENVFKNTNGNKVSGRNSKNQALSKYLDNLRKFEKLKRKLGNSHKANDTEIKTERNPDLFCFKTPGSFPDVEYPQSISETRTPKFWNYMPYIDKKELADDFRDSKAKLLLKNFSLPVDSKLKNNRLMKNTRVFKTTDLKKPPSKPKLAKPVTKEIKLNMKNETQMDNVLENFNTRNISLPYQTTKLNNTEDNLMKSKNVEVIVHKTNELVTNAPLRKEDVVISRRYRKSKCTSDPYYQNNNYTTEAPINSMSQANIVNGTFHEETTETDESDDYSKKCLSPIVVLEDIDTEKNKDEKSVANSIESFNFTSELCDDDEFETVSHNPEKLADNTNSYFYMRYNDTDSKENTTSFGCNISTNQSNNSTELKYETTANEYFNIASNKEPMTPSKSSQIIYDVEKNTYTNDMNLLVVTAQPYLNDLKLKSHPEDYLDLYPPPPVPPTSHDFSVTELPTTKNTQSLHTDLPIILLANENEENAKDVKNCHQTFKPHHTNSMPKDQTMPKSPSVKVIIPTTTSSPSIVDFDSSTTSVYASPLNIKQPDISTVNNIPPENNTARTPIDPNFTTSKMIEPDTFEPQKSTSILKNSNSNALTNDKVSQSNITVTDEIIIINDPDFEPVDYSGNVITSSPIQTITSKRSESSFLSTTESLFDPKLMETITTSTPFYTQSSTIEPSFMTISTTKSQPITTTVKSINDRIVETTHHSYFTEPASDLSLSTKPPISEYYNISTTPLSSTENNNDATFKRISATSVTEIPTPEAPFTEVPTPYTSAGTTDLLEESVATNSRNDVNLLQSTTILIPDSNRTNKPIFTNILDEEVKTTSENKLTEITTLEPKVRQLDLSSTTCAMDEFDKYQLIDAQYYNSNVTGSPSNSSANNFTILDSGYTPTSIIETTTSKPYVLKGVLNPITTTSKPLFDEIIPLVDVSSTPSASSSSSSVISSTTPVDAPSTDARSETTTKSSENNYIYSTTTYVKYTTPMPIPSTEVTSQTESTSSPPMTDELLVIPAQSNQASNIHKLNLNSISFQEFTTISPKPDLDVMTSTVPESLNSGPSSNHYFQHIDEVMTTIKSIPTTDSMTFSDLVITTPSPRLNSEDSMAAKLTYINNFAKNDSQGMTSDADMTATTTINPIFDNLIVTETEFFNSPPTPKATTQRTTSSTFLVTDISTTTMPTTKYPFLVTTADGSNLITEFDNISETKGNAKNFTNHQYSVGPFIDSNESTDFTTTTDNPIYTDLCDNSNTSTISSALPSIMNTFTTNFPTSYVTLTDLITTTSTCEVSDTDSNNYVLQSTPTSSEVNLKDTDPIDFTCPEKKIIQANSTLEDVLVISDNEIVNDASDFTVLNSILNYEKIRNSSSDAFETTPLPFHSSNTDCDDVTNPSIDNINTNIISCLHKHKSDTYLNNLHKISNENIPAKSFISDIKMSNSKSFQSDKLRQKLPLVKFESIDELLSNSIFINTDEFSVKTTTAQPNCDDFDTANNTCHECNFTKFSTDIINTTFKSVPSSDKSGKFLAIDTTTSSPYYTKSMAENDTYNDINVISDTEFLTTSVLDIITTAKPFLDSYSNSDFTPYKVLSTTPLPDFEDNNDVTKHATTRQILECNDPNTHLHQMTSTSVPLYKNNISVTTSFENNSVSPETITFGIPESFTCLPFNDLNESLFLQALMPKKISKFIDNFTFSTSTSSSTPEDYVKNVIHRDTSKQSDKDEEIDSIVSLTPDENISDIGNMDDDYPILTNIIESIIDQYFLDMYYDDSSETRIEPFANQNNNEYQDIDEIMIENNKKEEYLGKTLSHLNEHTEKTNEFDDDDGDVTESTQNQPESIITEREDSFDSPPISNISSQTLKDGNEPLSNGSTLSSNFDTFKSNLIKALDIVITKLKLGD